MGVIWMLPQAMAEWAPIHFTVKWGGLNREEATVPWAMAFVLGYFAGHALGKHPGDPHIRLMVKPKKQYWAASY